MPDIREVLNALDEQDRVMYSHLRTTMRAEYINAVHSVINVRAWNAEDDSFMDLIDIKLATLFDRAGRFTAAKGSIDDDRAAEIEQQITEAAANITNKAPTASQRALAEFAPKPQNGNHTDKPEGWK